MDYPVCSEHIKKYFDYINDYAAKAFNVAKQARSKCLDPADHVEITFAPDVAARVEGLVGPPGIAKIIRDMESHGMDRQLIANDIVKKIVRGEIVNKPKNELLDLAVRVGVSVLTEGVLVAPTEGITKIIKGTNADGSDRVDIYFAGPIRSAGGTIEALSVVLADVARKELDIGKYMPTESEVERYVEETDLYDRRCARLQYRPSDDDIRTIVRNIPVCVNGEPTNDIEVSVHRNVHGVSANKVRGGVALVICEGIAQKAPKLLKYTKKIRLDTWNWVEKIVKVKKKKSIVEIKPIRKFLNELIAGRPVFSYPSEKGGFRLRYGRTPLTGIMSKAFHPATLEVLDNFLVPGTQGKLERPGKSCIVTLCNTIEGPVVLLDDGSVIKITTKEHAEQVGPRIKKILFVGDILVSIGDMLKSGHPIIADAWCDEWWHALLKSRKLNAAELHGWELAKFCLNNSLPLAPELTKPWHDITDEEIEKLRNSIVLHNENEPETLRITLNDKIKKILENLYVLHHINKDNNEIIIDEHPCVLLVPLGLWKPGKKEMHNNNAQDNNKITGINMYSPVLIKPWASLYIGMRMGRPEKARMRKMKTAVHTLFPVSDYDRMRNIVGTVKKLERDGRQLYVDLARRRCTKCGLETIYLKCDVCGGTTVVLNENKLHDIKPVDLVNMWKRTLNKLKIPSIALVKGVIGMMSTEKIPERLDKGILRAKHNVIIYKDGTCRFDATDIPITHFRAKDINTDIETLKQLGYEKDCKGMPLENKSQVIEILPQDIIINNNGKEFLFNMSRFIDELLVKFYNMKPFYNLKKPEDITGHLCIGLAPHISGGTICRVIGFTDVKGTLGHPYFHTAKRRNCDGDEDTIILLLDGLINFSMKFKPRLRGGSMDMPIVLTTIITPKDVDDEVFNMEISSEYPLTFYEAAEKFENNFEGITFVRDVLGTEKQFQGFGYTHGVDCISNGHVKTTYTKFKSIRDKVFTEFELQNKIRAVDNKDVAEKIILSHFIPDLYGNLRKFSQQTFRCVQCNTKYRRVPLRGKCTKCGGKLVLTIHQGGVKKYLEISKEIAEMYDLPDYLKQRLALLEKDIESVFVDELHEQTNLSEFF